MDSPDKPLEDPSLDGELSLEDGDDSADSASDGPLLKGISPEPDPSMQEYYQFQKELFVITLLLAAVMFVPVWMIYSLNIALNTLIGACVGVVYLKMLAKGVEQLGRQKAKVGKNQLALFIGSNSSRIPSGVNCKFSQFFLGFPDLIRLLIIAYMYSRHCQRLNWFSTLP